VGHCASAYLHMGVLNDYVRYLPTLKDSPKAVPTTKKENIPFSKADLAAIILASVPIIWQNQYNPTHLTVPESSPTLLPDLENIEQVMDEKQNKTLNITNPLMFNLKLNCYSVICKC
jgi:hypothetical protein